MTSEENLQLENWRRQFHKLEKNVDIIQMMLEKQDGFLFIKWHTYSQTELLENNIFSKLDSATDKISDQLEEWIRRKNISQDLVFHYNALRDNLEFSIDDLRQDIIERRPTFWEKIRTGFKLFFSLLISKLPRIVLRFLTGGKSDIIKLLE